MIPIIFAAINNEHDKNKMEQIWNVYKNPMLKIAYGILKSHHAAEDSVQEASFKIMRHLDKIKEISSNETKAYIVYIVRSTSLDILRKAKKNMENYDEISENIPGDSLDIPDHLIAKEGYEAILEAIKSLPDNLRVVVYYSLVHGHSHKEIASLMDITEETSRIRLHRARKEIIKRLECGKYGK